MSNLYYDSLENAIQVKWHSDTEMPPKDTPLLCYGARGAYFVATFELHDKAKGKLFCTRDGNKTLQVKAWMEIPRYEN